jgi:hypothetical protein
MATRPTKATGTGRAQDPAASVASPGTPSAASRKGRPAVSRKGRPVASQKAQPPAARPRALRLAAAAQALEAVGMCVAAAFSAVSTVDGQSYQRASGVALTLIALGVAAAFAAFAAGLARARPWVRTPVVMTQLFVAGAGIYLLEGRRFEWGVPALLLAACCLAALFTPASLRALNRPAR